MEWFVLGSLVVLVTSFIMLTPAGLGLGAVQPSFPLMYRVLISLYVVSVDSMSIVYTYCITPSLYPSPALKHPTQTVS